MVLESVEEITENNQSPGYEVGDHKLIFKNTYDSAEYGKEKKFTINAKNEKSPDAFYYVHIDVDLGLLQDVPEPKTISNDPATPLFDDSHSIRRTRRVRRVSEESYNESVCCCCFNC